MRKYFLAIFIGLLVFSFVPLGPFFANINQAEAVSLPFIPFGGRILKVITCDEGLLITIGWPRGGEFMFTAGSILYAWYQIYRPGPWALGIALPIFEACTIDGEPIGGGLIMHKVGTSLK